MFPADGAQFSSFLTAFLLGIGLGVLYEAFRVPRLLFRISPVLVLVADTLYFFLCSVILFLFVFFTNDGQLRLFLLLSTVVGCLFYALTDVENKKRFAFAFGGGSGTFRRFFSCHAQFSDAERS